MCVCYDHVCYSLAVVALRVVVILRSSGQLGVSVLQTDSCSSSSSEQCRAVHCRDVHQPLQLATDERGQYNTTGRLADNADIITKTSDCKSVIWIFLRLNLGFFCTRARHTSKCTRKVFLNLFRNERVMVLFHTRYSWAEFIDNLQCQRVIT